MAGQHASADGESGGPPLRVIVSGTGRMGREVMAGIARQPDMTVVGVLERFAKGERIALPDGGDAPLSADAERLLGSVPADALVDFTFHEWTQHVAPLAVRAGVRPVIGTTGLPDPFVERLTRECAEHKVGGIVAANFALGAVLLMHLCRVAAPFFDYAEVIELHHEAKIDAPSGTAYTTVREMLRARGDRPFIQPETTKFTLPGTRGGSEGGVTVHSVRLQGLVAHQEVIFGALGQTLTLRHDTTSRESFIPGVLLAVRHLMARQELVIGLDRLMGLEP
ncbi:MAG TPA: 4-hydroxy-tetrahydrodipicolinate reductase [Dehalococcoidia bacterium]|jgi:4-hydroxy-tetrahydrodipicolinate reductase